MSDYSNRSIDHDLSGSWSENESEDATDSLVTIASIASASLSQPQDWMVYRFYLQSLARQLLPGEKVHQCLRAIVPGRRSVDLKVDYTKQKAHYANLITCGRVWQCPVCASKITDKRAKELRTAVTNHQHNGGFVAMLTFTQRHNLHDDLHHLVKTLRAASSAFKSGRGFQQMKDRYGWIGSVTAMEVTYGENGWHPHLHMLAFFDPMAEVTWREFTEVAKARWITMLNNKGSSATWDRGLDIRVADDEISNYIEKFGRTPNTTAWTIDREMAKAPVKRAHGDGMTPFQMLERYGLGDEVAGGLFQQYVRAFKGSNQLTWSNDLREKLALDRERDDEELAAEVPQEAELFASLSPAEWQRVLRLPRDIRAELLIVAGRGDLDLFERFLHSFRVR